VTGDAPATAAIVAHAVGLDGPACPPGPIRQGRSPTLPPRAVRSLRRRATGGQVQA